MTKTTPAATLKLTALATLCASLLITGCSMFRDSSDFPPLEGDRISVLELQRTLEPENTEDAIKGVIVPSEWKNAFWPQSGGYPNHSMQNLALKKGELKLAWKADIGAGTQKRLPLTSQPIVVDGNIFTLDSESILSSFSIENGAKIWERDVNNKDEDDTVITGGLAFSNGMIFVTNGYDEILTVRPDNGKIIWRQNLPSPSRAAPTVMDGRAYVNTLDNKLLALKVEDGSLLWEYIGIDESASLLGAASAAANRDIVIPAFSSGEITALRVENGSVAWSDNLSNVKGFGGLASLADIKGLPVIDKGLVFAISFSGRLVAIDERTGNRIWQREIGGSSTPWVAGNHIFVISSDKQFVALNRDNGVIRWVTDLPKYEDPEDRDGPIIWNGPLLAGGRLLAFSSKGEVLEFSPETGKTIAQWTTGRALALSPIVAGNTLYVLAEDGTLLAYR